MRTPARCPGRVDGSRQALASERDAARDEVGVEDEGPRLLDERLEIVANEASALSGLEKARKVHLSAANAGNHDPAWALPAQDQIPAHREASGAGLSGRRFWDVAGVWDGAYTDLPMGPVLAATMLDALESGVRAAMEISEAP